MNSLADTHSRYTGAHTLALKTQSDPNTRWVKQGRVAVVLVVETESETWRPPLVKQVKETEFLPQQHIIASELQPSDLLQETQQDRLYVCAT